MGKIVPQVMERDIVDEIPFLFGSLVLKSLKPEMNAVLRQSPPVVLPFGDGELLSLRGKHARASRFARFCFFLYSLWSLATVVR